MSTNSYANHVIYKHDVALSSLVPVIDKTLDFIEKFNEKQAIVYWDGVIEYLNNKFWNRVWKHKKHTIEDAHKHVDAINKTGYRLFPVGPPLRYVTDAVSLGDLKRLIESGGYEDIIIHEVDARCLSWWDKNLNRLMRINNVDV